MIRDGIDIEFLMPVLPPQRNLPGCPKAVPMNMLNETRAQRNHGQSLKRLAERGGLSVQELMANINDTSVEMISNEEAVKLLNEKIDDHLANIIGNMFYGQQEKMKGWEPGVRDLGNGWFEIGTGAATLYTRQGGLDLFYEAVARMSEKVIPKQ